MNVQPFFPSVPQLTRETIAILLATLGAAWIISRFPSVRSFVNDSSVVIRNTDGTTIRL